MKITRSITALTTLALAIMAVAGNTFAQNTADVTARENINAQVGRGRNILEDMSGLPGKHNLVKTEVRRLKAVCAERGVALLSDRDAFRGVSREQYEQADKRYQALVATEECGERVSYHESWNLVTNAGLNWIADILGNTSTPTVNTQCNFIGLTNSVITPGATDTTLTGEIVSNGLTRAQGVYTHSANATTFTIAKTFTATGGQSAQAGAVFTAISSGTMCYEDTFTAATLAINDTLSVTWTITI